MIEREEIARIIAPVPIETLEADLAAHREGKAMPAQSGEYIDQQTGIRLTVETEHPYDPDWPHITVYPPEQCTLTTEEMKEAVKRLVRMAGYDESLHQWVEKQ